MIRWILMTVVGALACGCVSQTLVMERTSSGAVERDVDFAPIQGPDGHYISLPAYPLANCVDTLVYNRLIARISEARTLMAKTKKPNTNLSMQAAQIDNADKKAVQIANGPTESTDDMKSNEEARLTAARDYARALLEYKTPDDLDKLLEAVGRHNFSSADLANVAAAFTTPEATDDFIDLADAYRSTPCASARRYRNFLGYVGDRDAQGVSWIDKDQPEQLKALRVIDANTAIGARRPPATWPRPVVSFLHFSDVQIREPNAKLGGTELSHQLKTLVSSFEQDYEQEQYALYVYDAIVKTANAEIELCQSGTCDLEHNSRPPPDQMIHTGDSADTGLQSEFDTFLTYTNHLHVPWYQVIGNHDVLAFGNMRLSSKSPDAPQRPKADICEGTAWDRFACTCTSLNALVRNQELPTPDNRGRTPATLPSPLSPFIPLLLQRICLLHAVAADWFVMDPDKQANGKPLTGMNSFMYSHCAGWHPKPGATAPFDKETCKPSSDLTDAVRAAYAVRPPPEAPDETCATLPPDAPPGGADPDVAHTTMHGFDLIPGFWKNTAQADPPGPTSQVRVQPQGGHGYYCFQMKPAAGNNTRKVWAVVLNTNSDVGAYGYLSAKQLEWLEKVLPKKGCDNAQDRAPGKIGCDDLVLIFSHHPIYSIYDQQQRLELTRHVTESPNVIGYFAGHIHSAGLRVVQPVSPAGTAKWEIIAPSVIDYPQAARQVTVKTAGDLGYIEVLTFTAYGSGSSVEKIRAAEAGAIRDTCKDHPDQCDNGRIRLPAREVTFPRAFFRMPSSRSQSSAKADHAPRSRARPVRRTSSETRRDVTTAMK